MTEKTASSATFADSRPHYGMLDGLRGTAALLVVFYHIFEGYAFASGDSPVRVINHGYLAVDFFFMLSGFVIGYAYDGRWKSGLGTGSFFLRRIVRLHPMVVMGALLGCLSFILQGGTDWSGHHAAGTMVLLSLLCALLFIPAWPGAGYEVRGNGEMFPLNGPSWSLFFEYIGNILYAFLLRRLPYRALAATVILSGAALAVFAAADVSGYGMIGVGWTLDAVNFSGGLIRMLFPFSFGLLLSRGYRPIRIRGAFWICSLLLAALFFVPHIGGSEKICLNGVYEFACIAVAFPLVVVAGASSSELSGRTAGICRFLGDISYPLYAVHYPVMYLFYSWLIDRQLYTFRETWWMSLAVFSVSVFLAFACMRLYDVPVRKWLGRYLVSQSSRK